MFVRVRRQIFFAIIGISLSIRGAVTAEDWPRFRGPDGQGHATLVGLPAAWDVQDYEWTVSLPGVGHSSPVIAGERLFLAAGTDDGRRLLLCLDATTGQTRWSHSESLDANHLHNKNSYGSSTPAVSDDSIYALFVGQKKMRVVALTLEGDVRWQKDLGQFDSQHGHGSSPIVHNGLVIVADDQLGQSSIVALDATDGEIVWRTENTSAKTAYATPVVTTVAGREVLITLCGAEGVVGFDPQTGGKLFASGALPERVVASPVIVDDMILVSCGSGGTGKRMEAVVPARDGEQWSTSTRWVRTKLLPYVPTPIFYEGHLYLWNDAGTVVCVDPADGSDVWKKRIGGKFSASPVVINGRLYAVSEAGDVHVFDASVDGEEYGGGRIDDESYATPSVAGGRLYLRGFSSLSCLRSEM